MKAGLTLLLTCLLSLPLLGCTDDPIDPIDPIQIDQDDQRELRSTNTTPNNTGHNTKCTNSSPQPCPCNTSADCQDGFYCQVADSTPLYGYCFPKPTCNAGDPFCP